MPSKVDIKGLLEAIRMTELYEVLDEVFGEKARVELEMEREKWEKIVAEKDAELAKLHAQLNLGKTSIESQ